MIFIYMSQNFGTFEPFALSSIYAVGYLERQSTAARNYTSSPFRHR